MLLVAPLKEKSKLCSKGEEKPTPLKEKNKISEFLFEKELCISVFMLPDLVIADFSSVSGFISEAAPSGHCWYGETLPREIEPVDVSRQLLECHA
ncbi:hypothetical protein AVEN_169640-1 [Araneus ventricosus]|uniref:Uncharacterized protein n=1 Tax=Araneus ventricosus TaxID=182803 RepID=A0A4Y2VPX7_ARAVE|nr:hypothetical protein AVEN_169640-1 [Araneus ventricosus]